MQKPDPDKERQEVSLVGRLLCLESLLFLVGVASLVYGALFGELMNIFWGLLIIPGVFVLRRFKQKDWKAHWAEQDEFRRLLREREEQGKNEE